MHESDPMLAGKKALIVDDDMRNIYALTSLLERHKMRSFIWKRFYRRRFPAGEATSR